MTEYIHLKRKTDNGVQTTGELQYNGVIIAKTLELPYKNNAKRISCIPAGEYKVVRRKSTKYGLHFHILNVPSRAYILIHHANYYKDLLGCIGVGEKIIDINKDGQPDITYSKRTMRKLLELLPETFTLIIESIF